MEITKRWYLVVDRISGETCGVLESDVDKMESRFGCTESLKPWQIESYKCDPKAWYFSKEMPENFIQRGNWKLIEQSAKETPQRECIGCGFCCKEAPCVAASIFFRMQKIDRCPGLYWANDRYWCYLPKEHEGFKTILKIGEGCEFPDNACRFDFERRKKNV